MVKLPDFLSRRSSPPVHDIGPASLEAQACDAQLEMGSALIFGLELRNARLHFIEHCARVAETVDKMASAFGLPNTERQDLRTAAQVHEIGMISVPEELLASVEPLDPDALARLRAQAAVGAEILRATHSSRTCLMVEHQYTDFDEIRLRFEPGSRDILLAGILRAADVLDTMQHPRPYQADLDPALGGVVLHGGCGTRFHPQAVESLLKLHA